MAKGKRQRKGAGLQTSNKRRKWTGAAKYKSAFPTFTMPPPSAVTYGARLSAAETFRSMLGEGKHHNTHIVPTGRLTFNGTIYDLSNISQGSGASNRDGNVVYPKVLEVGGYCAGPDGALGLMNNTTFVRLIIFQWLPNDSVAPVVSDILDSSFATTISPGVSGAPFCLYNSGRRNTRKILFDKVYTVHDANASGPSPQVVKINERIPVKIPRINYTADASTSGYNKLHLLVITSAQDQPGEEVTLRLGCRLWYRDG